MLDADIDGIGESLVLQKRNALDRRKVMFHISKACVSRTVIYKYYRKILEGLLLKRTKASVKILYAVVIGNNDRNFMHIESPFIRDRI